MNRLLQFSPNADIIIFYLTVKKSLNKKLAQAKDINMTTVCPSTNYNFVSRFMNSS